MLSNPYIVQSPVLFLVFNRPETTQRVFQEIRAARPSRLYIGSDGPRAGNEVDAEHCATVRRIVLDIDWPCVVETLFNAENKGCKIAVSDAISWFFSREEAGIILEDDCLPNSSFFYFADEMLRKYATDDRIFCITGTNMQHGQIRGDGSYYFSQLSNIWGWASWRRVWKYYDRDLKNYAYDQAREIVLEDFDDPVLQKEWLEIFNRLKRAAVDTWDQQFQFLTLFHHAYCITPNRNLISNIGFGAGATHTVHSGAPGGNLPLQDLTTITDPAIMKADKEADYYLFNQAFLLDEKRIKFEKDKLLRRRLKNWVRGFFTKSNS